MTTNTTDIQQELIEAIEASRDEAQAIVNELPENDETYIIVCGDLPIQFGCIRNGVHSRPSTATLSKATRFVGFGPSGLRSVDAVKRVAYAVKNGEGTRGHVVNLRKAALIHIDTQNELLDTIESNIMAKTDLFA